MKDFLLNERAPFLCEKEVATFIKILEKNTSSTDVIEIIRTTNPKEKGNSLKIGVLFSGGPAPGGNSVIYSIAKLVNCHDGCVIGFHNGILGLINNETSNITIQKAEKYCFYGGFDLLGTSRKKIEKEKDFEAAAKTTLRNNLDGLVIIGGDDSNTNASYIADYFKTKGIGCKVVGVPKTIDGDLKNVFIDVSFGFDSCVKTLSTIICNIQRDAISAKKYFHFICVMGRSASHIAIGCALNSHPNFVVISERYEESVDAFSHVIKDITEMIIARVSNRLDYGSIIIPESLGELCLAQKCDYFMSLLDTCNSSSIRKDDHGNITLKDIHIESIVKRGVIELLNTSRKDIVINTVTHSLGYEARCAPPSSFDVTYCLHLGFVAYKLIEHQMSGYMACVKLEKNTPQSWKHFGVPLTSMMHKEIRDGEEINVIKKWGISCDSKVVRELLESNEKNCLKDEYPFIASSLEDSDKYALPFIAHEKVE